MTNSKNPESTVVDLFFNHGVIKVDASSPFVLSSGAKAPIYLDHRRAFTNPVLRKNLVTIWAQKIESELKNLGCLPRDVVFAGTATAGIAPAMALANQWDCEFIYVRQKPKGHGLQQMVEGEFNPRKPHVVVDDMMTTGQSVLKSVEVLRQLDTRMVMSTTVTTHAIPSSHRKFESINLPFVALFETVQILEVAKGMGLISQSELRTVLAWLEGFSAMNDSID
ncbi:MAG: orotate phosphoribosyltransferase [Silvanigrellaceae bacterium]